MRLRELRVRAQLTQDEAAERMGLDGKQRRKTVERLEHGRIGNPSLDTIGRFLRACGASWGEVTAVLDRGESVEIDTKPIADTEFEVRDKQRMEWAVEKQVRKFETNLARPIGAKPLHPKKQAEAVRKLRNYRMVVSIIEEAVAGLLADKPVVSIEYPRYKAVAREVVGLLWREARRGQKAKVKVQGAREPGSKGASLNRDCRLLITDYRLQNEKTEEESAKSAESAAENRVQGDFKLQIADYRLKNGGMADKLAMKAEYWQMQKLDAELVREVQDMVIQRFAALRETNPELF